MQSVSPHAAGGGPPKYAARSYRHPICTLAYVRLDHANGGIIRNLSDSGMAIQAIGRLHPEQIVHLRFEFIRPRAKFELVGQVAWADAKGQAGICFADVPSRTRRWLKDWILTDLLMASLELTAAPVLNNGKTAEGLIASSVPLRSIRLASREPVAATVPAGVESAAFIGVPWWPTGTRQRTLVVFVDAMAIVSAVLLFSIIVFELTDVPPSWPVLVSTQIAVAAVFALVYRYLCRFLIGGTLGFRLAQLAKVDTARESIPSASDES